MNWQDPNQFNQLLARILRSIWRLCWGINAILFSVFCVWLAGALLYRFSGYLYRTILSSPW